MLEDKGDSLQVSTYHQADTSPLLSSKHVCLSCIQWQISPSGNQPGDGGTCACIAFSLPSSPWTQGECFAGRWGSMLMIPVKLTSDKNMNIIQFQSPLFYCTLMGSWPFHPTAGFLCRPCFCSIGMHPYVHSLSYLSACQQHTTGTLLV